MDRCSQGVCRERSASRSYPKWCASWARLEELRSPKSKRAKLTARPAGASRLTHRPAGASAHRASPDRKAPEPRPSRPPPKELVPMPNGLTTVIGSESMLSKRLASSESLCPQMRNFPVIVVFNSEGITPRLRRYPAPRARRRG